MENGSCNVENGGVKWKMEVGKWKSETRSGMAPIGHGMNVIHLHHAGMPDVFSQLRAPPKLILKIRLLHNIIRNRIPYVHGKSASRFFHIMLALL